MQIVYLPFFIFGAVCFFLFMGYTACYAFFENRKPRYFCSVKNLAM